ncbi:MAG: flavin reductase [Candidatus Peribacteraceae bacterium]|nr:flavin reductase [Candidatus Peribacteraceae bacterium]
MDIPYGSTAHHAFVTNVGLVTSTGPQGENIMAAEWTHHLSYKPGIIAVCLGPSKATTENIRATKEFGVSIAAENQNVLSSLAGGYSGKKVKKMDALRELGFRFVPGKVIKAPLVEGAAIHVECRLMEERVYGDHILFVGEAVEGTDFEGILPVIYNRGKYWKFGDQIQKPPEEELNRIKAVMEKHAK